MSRPPPPIDAWVIEAEADLTRERGGDTALMIRTWASRYDLEVGVQASSEALGVGGARSPGDLDRVSLSGEIGSDQINELASQFGRAYDVQVFVRRAQLVALPQMDMQTMQPTGEFLYVVVDTAERARQRREPTEGEKDVH